MDLGTLGVWIIGGTDKMDLGTLGVWILEHWG